MKNRFLLLLFCLVTQVSLAQATFEYDAAGNRVKRNVIGVPDLTPIFYPGGSPVHGAQTITLVAQIYELAPVPTPGLVSLYFAKDPYIVSLSFDPAATFIGGRVVQNANWTFNSTDPDFYIFTSTGPLAGGGSLKIGLTGLTVAGRPQTSFSLIGTVTAAGEVNLSNNQSYFTYAYFPN